MMKKKGTRLLKRSDYNFLHPIKNLESYAIAKLYETELRQQKHRIDCGRIWKNYDESISQDEEDYDEYEPVPVFLDEKDYDEYEYDEFNSPRTILEMAASHLLHDSQKDYNHLVYSSKFHFYIGDHIMAYYLDDIHGHIHCLAKPKVRADDAYRPHSTNSPSIYSCGMVGQLE